MERSSHYLSLHGRDVRHEYNHGRLGTTTCHEANQCQVPVDTPVERWSTDWADGREEKAKAAKILLVHPTETVPMLDPHSTWRPMHRHRG